MKNWWEREFACTQNNDLIVEFIIQVPEAIKEQYRFPPPLLPKPAQPALPLQDIPSTTPATDITLEDQEDVSTSDHCMILISDMLNRNPSNAEVTFIQSTSTQRFFVSFVITKLAIAHQQHKG